MKLVRWTRFTWDLSKLPVHPTSFPTQYQFRSAARGEEGVVRSVILSAFSLDMDWNDTMATLRQRFEVLGETSSFGEKNIHCLVLTHGSRIIAASALDTFPESENHLISGPCVLNEYRNRGFGSALLHRSLLLLRENGLVRAHGVTKANVQAAKFLYPKFNSVGEPYDFEPALVNS